VVLDFELRALLFLGKIFTTEATPPAIFAFLFLGYFSDRISQFCLGLALDCPMFVLGKISGMYCYAHLIG
jgi:hypothetical protein